MRPAALSPSEYAALAEHSPVLLWRCGVNARCDYFNETWLRFTGRSLEEELGEGWILGVHAEDRLRCLSVFRDHFDRRAPFELEYRLRRHDGAFRWILSRGVPVREAAEFHGFVGSGIDIHERHESALARETFLRMMAHELRTPLQAVQMFVEVVRRGAAAGEGCTPEMFDRLESQFDRFSRLVGDLAETGDADGSAMRRARLDLAALLRSLVAARSEELGAAPGRSRHRLAFRGPDHAEMEGDRRRLEQAFQNVLDNALKFSPRGGAVDVALESANHAHRVTVRDEGVGIPAEELEMVSRRFFRASNAPRRNFPGIGLGLAAARQIVEKHAGALSVASEAGRGTEVTIVLPGIGGGGP
jgi:PAS domain S-box-containing protein